MLPWNLDNALLARARHATKKTKRSALILAGVPELRRPHDEPRAELPSLTGLEVTITGRTCGDRRGPGRRD